MVAGPEPVSKVERAENGSAGVGAAMAFGLQWGEERDVQNWRLRIVTNPGNDGEGWRPPPPQKRPRKRLTARGLLCYPSHPQSGD